MIIKKRDIQIIALKKDLAKKINKIHSLQEANTTSHVYDFAIGRIKRQHVEDSLKFHRNHQL